ncbi:MAG: tyrosine-type recombinase/integrase [Bacillota bacterium]
MNTLVQSMQKLIQSVARDILINRNLAIIHLIRYKGLRPKEASSIDMHMVNLAQSTIKVEVDGQQIIYKLLDKHVQYIRDYLITIDQLKKPKLKSNDPLFVSFNNRSNDYQYDYANEQPKRLSARSIQEMIKDEVRLAGLRKLSAKHLRNSCILDHILNGQDDKEIQRYFHLTHPFSLYRYKMYQKNLQDGNK